MGNGISIGQISFFDMDSVPFKIEKPIRLIELFAGYGSQSLALRYLGANFEHWKISEWAIKSIQAYKDMHFPDAKWTEEIDVQREREWLKGRISSDYSNPLTDEQIDKLKDDDIRTIISNMKITHNLGSVCAIHGKDLEIVDQDKYQYILTYSFPCQDLSLAGAGKGMTKGSGTRSGLLWEVERILTELHDDGIQIDMLLMENVPQVHGENSKDDWNAWLRRLDELGYENYWDDLNAKDFGVAQNRDRCFCVSVPKGYYYTFPKRFKLEKRLKDYLEENVDEKYYLSDGIIKQISNWNAQEKPLKDIEREREITKTLTARGAGEMHAGMVLINEDVYTRN